MARYLIGFCLFLGLFISCKHVLPDQNPAGGNGGGGNGGGGNGGGSSGGNTSGNCDPNLVYFQQQVLPILVNNCTMSPCHDVNSHQDGVILTSYVNVMNTADVDPGDPLGSKLYRVLIDNDPDDRMPRPPAAPLSDADKNIIYKWIQQGAKDLTCTPGCDTSASVSFSSTITPILTAKCTGCHGGTNPQAGINLTTYAGVKAKINDGRFWGAINHQPGFSPMPKNGSKLPDCDLAKIKKWIDAGSPNN
jgi:hypothetical protein